jgi:phenylpyruvate tautomerase PptA (4-oxalocrotonate tautomerase family)
VPIITIESSVAPPAGRRAEVLATLVATVERCLDVQPPTEVRLRLIDVDPASAVVGGRPVDAAKPWIVANAQVIVGRPDGVMTDFMATFAETIASCYGVDQRHVRVLVHGYEKQFWGIGGTTAAALGR